MSNLSESYFTITSTACKVCNSDLRHQIDGLLLKKQTKPDGNYYTQAEVVAFAGEHGLAISQAALSRHLANHVKPGLRAMLETQERIDAASEVLSWPVDNQNYSILMADRERVKVLEHAAGGRGRLRNPSSELRPAMSWGYKEKMGDLENNQFKKRWKSMKWRHPSYVLKCLNQMHWLISPRYKPCLLILLHWVVVVL